MTDWQPIETAPMHTAILVAYHGHGVNQVGIECCVIYDPNDPHMADTVECPFCRFPLKQSEKHADGWYWHPPRSRRDMNCPFSAKRDKHGFYNAFFVQKRHAITAGTRSDKTT